MSSIPQFGLADLLRALEPPYRSSGEAQVGRVLDRYGIPFFYRQPTLIYEEGRHRVWLPDFTLPSYNGVVVEYAGAKDIPGYRPSTSHRSSTYAANGIPAVFVQPEELDDLSWPESFLDWLEATAEGWHNYDPARAAYGQPRRYG